MSQNNTLGKAVTGALGIITAAVDKLGAIAPIVPTKPIPRHNRSSYQEPSLENAPRRRTTDRAAVTPGDFS